MNFLDSQGPSIDFMWISQLNWSPQTWERDTSRTLAPRNSKSPQDSAFPCLQGLSFCLGPFNPVTPPGQMEEALEAIFSYTWWMRSRGSFVKKLNVILSMRGMILFITLSCSLSFFLSGIFSNLPMRPWMKVATFCSHSNGYTLLCMHPNGC